MNSSKEMDTTHRVYTSYRSIQISDKQEIHNEQKMHFWYCDAEKNAVIDVSIVMTAEKTKIVRRQKQ